jgi:hypothetical protein
LPGARHLLFDALLHDVGDGNHRRGDDREIHPRFQSGDGFNGRHSINGIVFGVYRQQYSFIAALYEIFHQRVADASRFFTGAHHRHPARPEDTIQIVLTHVKLSP